MLAALIIFGLLGAAGVVVWKKQRNSTELTDEPARPVVESGAQPVLVLPKEGNGFGAGSSEPAAKPSVKPAPLAFTRTITFRGHKGGVLGLAVTGSGQTILSVSDDKAIIHYASSEPGRHRRLHELNSPGVAVVLCDQDRQAVFCDGCDVVVYDLVEQKARATFENPRGGVRSLAAAPDGSFLLTGATDGCVRWWSVADKRLAHTLDIDSQVTATTAVTAAAITPDGKAAAFGLSDGRVCAWDLRTRREVKQWKAHAGRVTALAYSPDGRRLLSAGEDGLAIIWPPTGDRPFRQLADHDGAVLGIGWCSDSRRILTAGADGQVRLWYEGIGWKTDWAQDLPAKAFSLAVDSHDRFVLVGLSTGEVRLLPLPLPAVPPVVGVETVPGQ
jgi:WD40 repeat protein